MITTTPRPVKLWGRGQLTIPKEVRKALGLDEETHLNVFVVGRCVVMTPKRLLHASLAKDAERSMKERRLSMGDVLESLRKQRRRYNQESYGR